MAKAAAAKLRPRGQQQREQAQAAVRRITGEPAGIAQATMREATAVVRNAKHALRQAIRATACREIDELATTHPWPEAPR